MKRFRHLTINLDDYSHRRLALYDSDRRIDSLTTEDVQRWRPGPLRLKYCSGGVLYADTTSRPCQTSPHY